MFSKKIGRRKFVKTASSALLGMASGPFLKAGPSFAKTEKTPSLEYRTLGKTGLKITTVSMGS